MKFPSLHQLWSSFLSVCKRFSLPILYAVIATVATLILSYKNHNIATEQFLAKLIYLGNFGLALSFAFLLYAETHLLNFTKKAIGNVAILILLVLIYFALQPALRQADVFVLLILGFAFHLLVAFSAFFSNNHEAGFWQINKTFFLRFATSVLYSVVLFAGLSIALLSINTLFNIRWDGKIYLHLWIIIVGVFNTIFFLAGIPKPLQALNTDDSYPKALKVFTQYVLIPLASIYLLILLAYEVKIIAEWSLPTSSVAILILGYAVFGMLSILLVHPIRNQEGNKWIKFYSKSFYLLMLPLLALLAVAVVKRISDYGITESRYLLIVLSVWLTFITIYFLIKGREHIRIIPVSLFVFSVVIAVGPWGIKSVSRHSQSNRLESFISKKASSERDDEIRNLVRYLNEHFGSSTLQLFVKIDLNAVEMQKKASKPDIANWDLQRAITDTVLNSLQVSSIATNQAWSSQQRNYVNAENGFFSVKGALQVVEINSYLNNVENKKLNFKVDDQDFSLKVNSDQNLILSQGGTENIVFNVNETLKSLYQNKTLKAHPERPNALSAPNTSLNIKKELGNYIFIMRMDELSAFYPDQQPSKPDNIHYTGYLIIYPKM